MKKTHHFRWWFPTHLYNFHPCEIHDAPTIWRRYVSFRGSGTGHISGGESGWVREHPGCSLHLGGVWLPPFPWFFWWFRNISLACHKWGFPKNGGFPQQPWGFPNLKRIILGWWNWGYILLFKETPKLSNCSSSLKFNCFLPSTIIFLVFENTSFYVTQVSQKHSFFEATAATERCVAPRSRKEPRCIEQHRWMECVLMLFFFPKGVMFKNLVGCYMM